MTWEAKNVADPSSTLIMKFKKKKILQTPNWLRELVVKPSCNAGLLITGITVSVRGQVIAPDCWSLCVMRAEHVKDHSDYEVFVSEEVVCGVCTHMCSHMRICRHSLWRMLVV